ncbi:uncharacterized protein LOC124622083 isoform X2 [Schistocerca americana]|uniref:uncharacterized protein LOC124622083 isoform X2 n=1 Tax=Schistocerca americana TaxID=7009 RepID=UPI001F4F5F42|nr:uncharacterized protein LOC124622083 isoform X2 [Schistocerca americana]
MQKFLTHTFTVEKTKLFTWKMAKLHIGHAQNVQLHHRLWQQFHPHCCPCWVIVATYYYYHTSSTHCVQLNIINHAYRAYKFRRAFAVEAEPALKPMDVIQSIIDATHHTLSQASVAAISIQLQKSIHTIHSGTYIGYVLQ